jgi:hypothetical protein
MAVHKWSNVAIGMQSAIAAGKTITGITQASGGGVVSCTTNGYSNGDYVLITGVLGMYQVNGRVVRVSSQAADQFTMEGVDTSGFDAYVSGGEAQKITFGNAITTATSMSSAGGTFSFIDTTTIHQNYKSQIPGLGDPISYTFDNLWDAADAGQIAMKTASDSQAQLAFKFTFGSGGPIMVFTGYVGFTGSPGGNAQDKVTTSAVITAFGSPTYYAS